MQTLAYYKKLLPLVVFYDHSYDLRPKSLFSSDLSLTRLILRFLKLIISFPLSLMAWVLLRAVSVKYKVTIYILKPFRPGFASTYLNMMEPLCRQLQHEIDPRHIKILVDPGASISDVLVKSYEPHFSLYLDDRRKFVRLIAYLIPKSGIEKKIINTSDKYLVSWLRPPSKNYANLTNQLPSDLAKIGIEKENYVLFVHGSRNYYQTMLGPEITKTLQHRFADLSTYKLALNKIIEGDLKVVRVGFQVDELPAALKTLPIIDYTGEIRNEEGELWLYANCKFLLSIANGGWWFARRFDRPTLVTHSYSSHVGYMCTRFITLNFKDTTNSRLLTFAEIFRLRTHPNFLNNQFMKDNNLEFVSSSSLTIANAVNEMLDLVNNRYIQTSEDVELIERYNSLLASFNIPLAEKMSLPAISFLREYQHLF